jgi:GNAT superfamily N-acetyltransferase
MQFRAQNFNYALTYSDAVDQIIEADGQSIGRLKVLENQNEILLVDIALLPQHQNRGIGTMFLEQLKSRARDVKKPLRLHVLRASPAVLLYERLGFTRVADDGVYMAMELLPETTAITK